MQVWIDGDSYVLRGKEIDYVMKAAAGADSIGDAWHRLHRIAEYYQE